MIFRFLIEWFCALLQTQVCFMLLQMFFISVLQKCCLVVSYLLNLYVLFLLNACNRRDKTRVVNNNEPFHNRPTTNGGSVCPDSEVE